MTNRKAGSLRLEDTDLTTQVSVWGLVFGVLVWSHYSVSCSKYHYSGCHCLWWKSVPWKHECVRSTRLCFFVSVELCEPIWWDEVDLWPLTPDILLCSTRVSSLPHDVYWSLSLIFSHSLEMDRGERWRDRKENESYDERKTEKQGDWSHWHLQSRCRCVGRKALTFSCSQSTVGSSPPRTLPQLQRLCPNTLQLTGAYHCRHHHAKSAAQQNYIGGRLWRYPAEWPGTRRFASPQNWMCSCRTFWGKVRSH